MDIPEPMTEADFSPLIQGTSFVEIMVAIVAEQHRRDMWGMVALLNDFASAAYPQDAFCYGGPSNCEYDCLYGVAKLLGEALRTADIEPLKEEEKP